MNHTSIHYEKTIDLKCLGMTVLRQWKWILVVAVVAATVLAAVEYITVKVQVPTVDQSAITEIQDTINANSESIAALQVQLEQQRPELKMYEDGVVIAKEAMNAIKQVVPMTADMVPELIRLVEHTTWCEGQVNTFTQTIADAEQQIIDLQNANKALEEELQTTQVIEPAAEKPQLAKQAILGFAIGAVLVCCAVIVCYLFDTRMQNEKVFSEQFGIAVLASVHKPVSQEQLEKHKGIDKLLDRLAGANKAVDVDREYAIAAAKLQVVAGERKQVLITGTLPRETLDAAAKKLFAAMPGAELKAVVAQDLPNNPDAIVQIPNSTVLLVEEIGKTKVPAMLPALELLQQSKADVAGAFVL